MAAPAVLSAVYPDLAGVEDILGEAGVKFRLDDNQSNTVTAHENARLTRLFSSVTAMIQLHLVNYSVSDQAENWNVYYWSCVICSYRLCKRRNQPVTGSLQDMYNEAMAMLKAIQSGEMMLANVAMLASPSMSVSNLRLDGRYHTRQLRVEKTISDSVAAKHDQAVDWVSSQVPEQFPE